MPASAHVKGKQDEESAFTGSTVANHRRAHRPPKSCEDCLLPQTIADYDYTPTLAEHDVPMLLMRSQHDREINKQLDA